MASQVENIKWIPNTKFIVDGFRFQHPECSKYFLTHCHSDHTTGLTKRFDGGVIYGTPVTCQLLQHDMGLPPQILRPLELEKPAMIDGVEVTAICANHCPGACMFLFKVPQQQVSDEDKNDKNVPQQPPRVILHTGDFRWNSATMATNPHLSSVKIDVLFLDTTYCAPKWLFPEQSLVIQEMVDMMRNELTTHPETLFVVGSYHIGKERAYLGAAHKLYLKVYATPAKQRVLRLLGLPSEWMALLVDKPEDAGIHVLSMGDQLHEQALADRIKDTSWKRVVAIRPTGWTYRKKGGFSIQKSGSVVTLVGVPYSEHSSYSELRDCVKTLRPKKLVPTVNAGDAAKSRAIVDRLAAFMDLTEDRSRLDSYFLSSAGGSDRKNKRQDDSKEDEDDMVVEVIDGDNEQAAEVDLVNNNNNESNRSGDIKQEEVVDIDGIDIEEQQRILDAITAAQRHKAPGGGSSQKVKQGTIRAFLLGKQ